MAKRRTRNSKAPWLPVSEFDIDMNSECLVRCKCERPDCKEMHAYWTMVDGKNGTKFRAWVLENNVVCGLYDIAEFKMIRSMPFRDARAPVVMKNF